MRIICAHAWCKIAAIGDLFADDKLSPGRGIPVVTTNSNDILEHPDIDAVLICSSTDTHVPLIKQAAANGKHIFCEKPVSMSVDQTREALTAVEAAGVSLQIGFNRRFDHNFSRVREIVSAGRIGDAHLIKITSRDPSPPHPDYIKVSGGLFMDMAIHDFDIARFYRARGGRSVCPGSGTRGPCHRRAGRHRHRPHNARFENGALGVIDNSRKAVYGYDQRIEVFGSGGCVSADNDYPSTAIVSGPDGVTRDKPLYFFLERYKEAYMNETRQFIDSLQNGTAVPVSGHDALQAELIALAAKRSLQQGRPVRLAELTTGISSAG